MMSSLSEIGVIGRDPPEGPRATSPDTEPAKSPFTETYASTPATTMDTLSDMAKTTDLSPQVEYDDGADTPRKSNLNLHSVSLESQIKMLHSKLAQLEQQTEWERRERQMMEKKLMEETRPIALSTTMHETGRVPRWRHWRSNYNNYYDEHYEDSDEGAPFSKYASKTIAVFEKEIKRLREEQGKATEVWDELEQLRQMQETWVKEHEELELLKANAELSLEECASDASESDTDGSSDALDEEPATPAHETAEINYADWQHFKLGHIIEPQAQVFAIDVLKGDPVITWERPKNFLTLGWNRNVQHYPMAFEEKPKARKPAANLKSSLLPGQAPLPERIRINSSHIIRILEQMHDDSLSAPLVMIRPYKALAYYDRAIRMKFQELVAKFALDGTASENAITTDSQKELHARGHESEETETTKADEPASSGKTIMEAKDEAAAEDNQDELTSSLTAYQHLGCLIRFMDEWIHEKIKYLSSDACRTVCFSDIWYLFKPGDEVVEQSRRQVYRVISISSAPHKIFPPYRTRWDKEARDQEDTPIFLVCVYVDFNGKELGPMVRKVRIPRFDGEKVVTSLEVYPLRFAEERETSDKQMKTEETKNSRNPTLREKLITRGKMFMEVTNFKHMHYSGLTLDTRDEVDSDVVVDFEEAFSHAPKKNADSLNNDSGSELQGSGAAEQDWRPQLQNLIGQSLEVEFNDESCNAACCNSSNDDVIHHDAYAEKKLNQDYMTSIVPEDRQREPPPTIYPRPVGEIKEQEDSLDKGDYLIMSYRVFGFILRTRKWAKLDLSHLTLPQNIIKAGGTNEIHKESQPHAIKSDKIEEIDDSNTVKTTRKDETAFGQLVLPEGHKEMVTSLVAQHFRDKDSVSKESKEAQQVDIVRGKGKGLIILLHGAPGVGKTTTAEGVAEMFKKPLFQITCGDLGTSAPEVEKALETHFALANRWGCVLLLDEADVFLAARSKEDFKRNGLVSVFLRVLEYYAGILFLTTNRVGDFDEAFASRIHISLYYPQLTIENTQAIFELNLKMIGKRFASKGKKIRIEYDEIIRYARTYFGEHPEEQWNGRQIRNACQTALALAEFRAQGNSHEYIVVPEAVVELRAKDMEDVAKAYLQFLQYLNKVRGKNAEMWAKGMKLRAREIDVLLYGGANTGREKDYDTQESQNYDGKKNHDNYDAVSAQAPVMADNAPPMTNVPPRSTAATPQPPAGAFSSLPPASPLAPKDTHPVSSGIAPLGPANGQHYGSGLPPQPPWYYGNAPPTNRYPQPPNVQNTPPQTMWTPETIAWYQQQAMQQGNQWGSLPGDGRPPLPGPPPTR